MSVARHAIKDPFTRARIPGWISPWVHPGFQGGKRPKILGTSSDAKFEKQSNTAKHKNIDFHAYHSLTKWDAYDVEYTASNARRCHPDHQNSPRVLPVTGLKFSCGKIPSLRSKRFRLVSEQKTKNEERDFRFWLREKRNESLSSPPPPRSFTCAIFRAVFDSCSSFFTPNPHRSACYAGYKISSPLKGVSVGKTEISGTEPARNEHIENLKQRI